VLFSFFYEILIVVNYPEFKRHLGKAGMTIGRYAALLQINPNSVSNYAKRSEMPRVHALLAVMLGDARDRGEDIELVLNRYGLSSNAALVGSAASLEQSSRRGDRK
jgi:hypothetical protein